MMDNHISKTLYDACVALLRHELVPALGCTEPIAIAYAAAKSVAVLGVFPNRLEVGCSRNIIKNVKSVTVPNSGGLCGIEVAATLGAVAGDASKELEVLGNISKEEQLRTEYLVSQGFCSVRLVENVENLYIEVLAVTDNQKASVIIQGSHTNITKIMKNDVVLHNLDNTCSADKQIESYMELLDTQTCIDFANQVRIVDVQDIIQRQINLNTEISEEGLRGNYGVNVGKTLLKYYDASDVRIRACAKAAAGSDARMGGCSLPVVINSGSGNQGLTVSLPVVEYAKELKVGEEILFRALVLANLLALMQKRYIGNLSAFCGVVCAAAGAGGGIAFLHGGGYDAIANTITNTIANVGGIVCDGAKASCAAKVASALDAAILGFQIGMKENKSFKGGDGLVKNDIDKTIQSIGRMGREGMKCTDIEILDIMLDK